VSLFMFVHGDGDGDGPLATSTSDGGATGGAASVAAEGATGGEAKGDSATAAECASASHESVGARSAAEALRGGELIFPCVTPFAQPDSSDEWSEDGWRSGGEAAGEGGQKERSGSAVCERLDGHARKGVMALWHPEHDSRVRAEGAAAREAAGQPEPPPSRDTDAALRASELCADAPSGGDTCGTLAARCVHAPTAEKQRLAPTAQHAPTRGDTA
jgi:hypothetical protein